MKKKDTKQMEAYHAWSYQGIIELPYYFNGYVFNHGTESRANDRTAQHKNECNKQSYTYEVTYEAKDRVFGSKVISKQHDKKYVQKVAERLNDTILKNTVQKAMLLDDWFKTFNYQALNPKQQGDLNGLKATQVSLTECIFVPSIVSRDQLFEARKYVNAHWYFNNKSLLISAKPYKDKNTTEKKMAAKPIPRALHKRLIEALKAGKNFAQLLKYKVARIQGIELAYLISCLYELRNLEKIRVIITADDIKDHEETYAVLEEDPKFELVECDSDEAIVEEYKMNTLDIKPDLDVMNPPYDGSLHLNILETVVKLRQPNSTVVSIQPARWLEDPLANDKQGTDYILYKDSIINKITKLQLIDATTACKAFKIMNPTDLAIYTFTDKPAQIVINKQEALTKKLLDKIKTMSNLKEHVEEKAVKGFRCEVKEMSSGTGGHNLGNYESSKIADVNIIWGPYTDGYSQDGKFFTDSRQKNQFTKGHFAYSILFNTLEEATNFYLSCNTKFYRRLVHLFKFDVHTPLRFLPYMEDYSKVWTDKDYCEVFGLNEEESEFMCKDIDDYRIKDFINYITLN